MGAAALNHEVFNNTMEVQAVVVAHVDQFDKVRHGVGGAAMIKFDCDVSCAGLHECVHATPRWRGVKSIRFEQFEVQSVLQPRAEVLICVGSSIVCRVSR